MYPDLFLLSYGLGDLWPLCILFMGPCIFTFCPEYPLHNIHQISSNLALETLFVEYFDNLSPFCHDPCVGEPEEVHYCFIWTVAAGALIFACDWMLYVAGEDDSCMILHACEQSKLARRVQAMVAHPPDAKFKQLVSSKNLKNFPIYVTGIKMPKPFLVPIITY